MKKIALLLMFVCLMVGLSAFVSAGNETMLKINEVTVWVDGNKDTVSEGGSVNDVKPGSSVKINVELKNMYTDRANAIEDIEFELVGERLDEDEDDWEDEAEMDDIRGDDTDDVTFETHTIPLDVEEEEHTITISVQGECHNSTDICKDDIEFTLEVEKEKHELVISTAALEPQVLACDGSSTLSLKIYNIGREDEDDTVIEVKNDKLGLDFKDTVDIEICPGDDCVYSKKIAINSQKNQEAGTYPVSIKVTYDEGDETLSKDVNLEVEKCVIVPPIIPGCIDSTALNYNSAATKDDGSCEYEEEVEEEAAEIPEAVPITGGVFATPFSAEQIAVVSLIVLGAVLVIVLVVFLVVKAARKKQ